MTTTERFVGTTVLRKEDPELLTGQAGYIDNQTMPGMLWMALVRPPYVVARFSGVKVSRNGPVAMTRTLSSTSQSK